jgi:hypothetical protein
MKFEKPLARLRVLDTYISKYAVKKYQAGEYQPSDYFVTAPTKELLFTTKGISGDRHFGYDTLSGGRSKSMYPKGTLVRNNRQWLAVSPEEVLQISQNLGLEGRLTPELLGASMLIEGWPQLTKLPPMTHLLFSKQDTLETPRQDDVMLIVYAGAIPCAVAGKSLANHFEMPRLESEFVKGAWNMRGTTGWVEKGGIIRPGDYAWVLKPTGMD